MEQERVKIGHKWTELTHMAMDRLKVEMSEIKLHDLVLLAMGGTDKVVALSGGNRNEQSVNVTVTLADTYRKVIDVGVSPRGKTDPALRGDGVDGTPLLALEANSQGETDQT